MQIQFLLGPAGSGKTHRCLAEIRAELARSPEGAPLILLAPKQATFQLERQLLAENSLAGYTRLHILSFERLAGFVFQQCSQTPPRMLDEEGRLMVLRALLARRRDDLKLFRASARLTGFAQQLSLALRELQRNALTPESLKKIAEEASELGGLSLKLQDLATLLGDYLEWLRAHDLQDADSLLNSATEVLSPKSKVQSPKSDHAKFEIQNSKFDISGLWLDGFAEFSPQEMNLLATVVMHTQRATVALCLDRAPSERVSWLSNWSLAGKTFTELKANLAELPDAKISIEELPRDSGRNRFTNNPVLSHLEKFWPDPEPFVIHDLRFAGLSDSKLETQNTKISQHLHTVVCANPETEVTLAAREILKFVRNGGRFRDVAVILRSLAGYHEILQRVFSRYEIPFFLDRRENVSHHPLAELTRSALRVAAFNWNHDDFFAALKSGLMRVEETHLDRLENEALARGWKGPVWLQPIQIPEVPVLASELERVRKKIVPPFQILAETLGSFQNRPNGKQLADALREIWNTLEIEDQLRDWMGITTPNSELRTPNSSAAHATVWEQMNVWLDNIARAFSTESLSVREWLPILEAGLASLAVGVIPPALDQVLVGAIDRSRNPDIEFALVLGLNEGIFPAPPTPAPLLTDADCDELERRGIALGASPRLHIARERYFGYIACTRARQRLLLTCAANDSKDSPLNPSPFWSRMKQLFPQLKIETFSRTADWRGSEHAVELIAPLLKIRDSKLEIQNWNRLAEIPALKSALEQLRFFQTPAEETISPQIAEKLYGATLRSSVSRLEQFAACPFRFFVNAGLRAEERRVFELDVREQGNFQHDALELFHQHLRAEGKRWRDITPREARERIGKIALDLIATYRDGLLQASGESKFTARMLTDSLQDFIETLVGWMTRQYEFDPVQVELSFGEADASPAWELDLGDGHRLALRGRIDRVDVCCESADTDALCVVVDYKSSAKKLDSLLVENGLQLQLLAYLNVLRRWPDAEKLFGARLTPAGVFYVNLRGKYENQSTRVEALAEADDARKLAYRHSGRFDVNALSKLDARRDAMQGDQFNYRKTKSGEIYKGSKEALPPHEFAALLDLVEANLISMAREIFSGSVKVLPYRKGSQTACQQCDYQAICRIDPWTHPFRALKRKAE